ncbi:MAG: TIGR03067 domain-containing protein [Sedimentisphaerales bacterium]|nr:TIGR03067 domain-containing protein [Sedimentisphaerales bacterium]
MTAKHYSEIAICLAAILAASVGGCKSEPEPPVEVSDMDRLQGTWVGTEVGNDERQWTLTISGTKVDVNGPGPEDYSGTMKLNTEVEPKQADLLVEDCAVQQYVGTTSLAIYKIEGDTFTMAGNEPGSTVRPTQFEGGGGTRLFVLTKQ